MKALSFWKRHPALAPRDTATLCALAGNKRRRNLKRQPQKVEVVLVPLFLDNNTPIEEIAGEELIEKYDLRSHQGAQISLETPKFDDGIFRVENKDLLITLESILMTFTDEELKALSSEPVN